MARAFHEKNLLEKSIKGFYKHHMLHYYTPKQEQIMLKKSEKFYKLKIKKDLFSFWRYYAQIHLKPKNKALLRSQSTSC